MLDCKRASLEAVIRGKVELAATAHAGSFRSYSGIVHMGYKEHYRVRHDHAEFASGGAHTSGIEASGAWRRRGP